MEISFPPTWLPYRRHCASAQVPSSYIVMSAKLRAPSWTCLLARRSGTGSGPCHLIMVKLMPMICLACVRGFPQLRALVLPKNAAARDVTFSRGVTSAFYEALALRARVRAHRARLSPILLVRDHRLKHTRGGSRNHITAACSLLSLRCLVVEDCDRCCDNPQLIDGILSSSSAASLEEIEISLSERGLYLGGEARAGGWCGGARAYVCSPTFMAI